MEIDRLKFICNVFSEAYGIPIVVIDKSNKIIFEYATNTTLQTLTNSNFHFDIPHLIDWLDMNNSPIIKSINDLGRYIIIKIKDDNIPDEFYGAIVAGPIIDQDTSDDMIRESLFLNDQSTRKELYTRLSLYHEKLVTFSDHQLINCSLHLFFMVYQEVLNASDIIYQNTEIQNILLHMEDSQVVVSGRREQGTLHHDFTYEQKIIQAVKEGKKDDIPKLLRSFPEEGVGTLSKDSILRSRKNIGIAIIAVAVRAAIDGGLHYEIAYTFSDLYIQAIEQLKSANSIQKFLEDALIDLADKVRKVSTRKYSKHINKCVNYIYLNLNEDISLDKLAALVNLHPNYLSSLFNKEFGMSFREYIQHQRIEEAKKLLIYSNYSLSKISETLNFHDQSHFSRTFKKITGLTPTQFQNNKK